MQFCPKCGTLLVPENGSARCMCGYAEKLEKVQIREQIVSREIEIIDEKDENIGDSVVDDITCFRCGSRGAYTWFVQTRRSDEGVTRFFKCRKCKAVWRSGK